MRTKSSNKVDRSIAATPRETTRAPFRGGRRANRAITYILAGTLVVTLGGWVGSHFMTTPAQIAAEASPPPPTILTATIELRVVREEIVSRGEVRSERLTNVLAEREIGSGATVITALPVSVGSEVGHGGVVVQLSGRPVFALQGAFPAYRDLAQGATGPDVVQLQAALVATGFEIEDELGMFSWDTAAALETMYEHAGYASQASLPASEVVYVASLPARVESGSAAVGMTTGEAALNIATGRMAVYVIADAQIEASARAGAAVEVSSELLGGMLAGAVSLVQASPTSVEGGIAQREVVITTTEPMPAEWVGQDVRVRFIEASTTDAVLAVPLAAVSADGGGRTVLHVMEGRFARAVEISTGLIGGGYVEIRPLEGTLEPGQLVVIGTQ